MKVAGKILVTRKQRNTPPQLFSMAAQAEEVGMQLESCIELFGRYVSAVPSDFTDEPLGVGLEALLKGAFANNQRLTTSMYELVHQRRKPADRTT